MKKGFISEVDMALLLHRYTPKTLFTLLQEVANSADSQLNWKSLVKSTKTGINNAREYQALWRHLAYRSSIADTFEDDAEPLDDDSDLDFEVEPLPAISPEVAADVSACVKLLTAPGISGNTSSKDLETCFTIEIPNSSSGWEVKGNAKISSLVMQGNCSADAQPVKKKRKRWTAEEDQELVAAVEKCGEGNWATILKSAFKHDRTAAQLSQRWALIRKRREGQVGNNVGGDGQGQSAGAGSGSLIASLPISVDAQRLSTPSLGMTVPSTAAVLNSSSTLLASPNPAPAVDSNSSHTQNSPSITALPPLAGKALTAMKKVGSEQGRLSTPPTTVTSPLAAQVSRAGASKSALTVAVSGPGRYNVSPVMRNTSGSSFGSRTAAKGPDPMVQAAAVAAGARIAPPSAAASLLKAAQSGNVVHHMGVGGASVGKSSMPNQAGSNIGANSLKAGTRTPPGTTPFIHYIRTTGSPQQSLLSSGQKALQSKVQPSKTCSAIIADPARPTSGVPASGLPGHSVVSQKPVAGSGTALPGLRAKIKLSGDGSTVNLISKATEPVEGVTGVEVSKVGVEAATCLAAEGTPADGNGPIQVEKGQDNSVPKEELKPVETSLHGCSPKKDVP